MCPALIRAGRAPHQCRLMQVGKIVPGSHQSWSHSPSVLADASRDECARLSSRADEAQMRMHWHGGLYRVMHGSAAPCGSSGHAWLSGTMRVIRSCMAQRHHAGHPVMHGSAAPCGSSGHARLSRTMRVIRSCTAQRRHAGHPVMHDSAVCIGTLGSCMGAWLRGGVG